MTTKLKGSHPWVVILCCPSDRDVPSSPTPDYFTSFISEAGAGGAYDFWSQISGGRLDLAGSRVLGWYRLTQTVAQLPTGPDSRSAAAALARAAATAAGEDLSGYRYTFALIVDFDNFGNQGQDVVSRISAWRGQVGWRWCKNCECLAYWDGSREPGRCAGGIRHDHSGSSLYSIEHDTTITDGHAGWRWCSQCEAIVSSSFMAPCPAGGTHTLGDRNYVIRVGSSGPGEQSNWSRCNGCQCLVYNDAVRGPGPCHVSGRHVPISNYSVPQAYDASVGALSHEIGHAFGFIHAFGLRRSGVFGDDTRPGAYGDWTDLMSWSLTAQFVTPRFTPAGAALSAPMLHKLGWVNDNEVMRFSGSGTQTVTLVPLYGSAAGTRMVQVIRAPDNRIYTASYRPAIGWDRGLGTSRVVVHAQQTLYSVGQDCWFWCSNCQGMVYGEDMLCAAGGLHDGGASEDYGLLFNLDPVPASVGQNNWRWCSKCQGLAFAGNNTNGRCSAGDEHDLSGSDNYTLLHGGAGQPNWRWCHKCQGLGYGGQAMKGACPAGGLHDYSRSGNYVLAGGSGPHRQNKWRWCKKCDGLFYAGQGRCAGGEVHNLSGADYGLTHNLDEASGQREWKYCSKCRGLAFHDRSRAEGRCPAGDRHDHAGSGRYTLRTDTEAAAAQRHWFFCKSCSALHLRDVTSDTGRCFVSGTHIADRIEYEIARDTTSVPGDDRFRLCSQCACLVRGNNPAGCSVGATHDTSAREVYVVRRNPTTLAKEQSFWRVCLQCSVLMSLKSFNGANENRCPVSGMHTPGPEEYFVTFRTAATQWRWCRKCELLAVWVAPQVPGACPAGGTHDHTGSDFYYPPRGAEEAVQVVADNLRASGRYVAAAGAPTFEVVSITSDSAIVRVTT